VAAADVVIFGVVLHLFKEAFWKTPIIIFPSIPEGGLATIIKKSEHKNT